MDVRFFLKQRISFIRQFYVTASAGYIERKRLIEAEEEPFVPEYSEYTEPPFLIEWLEAEESLHVLGRTCVSMLAATFHLYFKTWERQIGKPVDKTLEKVFKKNGWFHGYKAYFAYHFHIRFEDGPVNLSVLEEIPLVRNRTQHPESIATDGSLFSYDDLKKLSHPFFIDESYSSLFSDDEAGERDLLIAMPIRVTAEKLFTALSEVENFAEWLENIGAAPEI